MSGEIKLMKSRVILWLLDRCHMCGRSGGSGGTLRTFGCFVPCGFPCPPSTSAYPRINHLLPIRVDAFPPPHGAAAQSIAPPPLPITSLVPRSAFHVKANLRWLKAVPSCLECMWITIRRSVWQWNRLPNPVYALPHRSLPPNTNRRACVWCWWGGREGIHALDV